MLTKSEVNPSNEDKDPLSLEQLADSDFVESMTPELATVAKVMAWYFVGISLFHPFFVIDDVYQYLIASALFGAGLCFYINWYIRHCGTPTKNILIIVQLSFVVVTTVNVILHMLLTKEVFQSTSIIMVFMLLAYLRLPLIHYCLTLFIISLIWLTTIAIIAESGDPLVAHFGFSLLFAGLITSVIRVTQVNLTSRKIVALHARSVLEHKLSKAYKKLERQAQRDPLTGVANRRKMSSQLDITWNLARDHKQHITVMICDVDNFKSFNDQHGHLVGDNVLIGLAKILEANAKSEDDLAARIGGDEFVLLLANCDVATARGIAADICAEVRKLVVDDHAMTITIGSYSLIPSDDVLKNNVFALADNALYEAKNAGRDGFVCSD